MNSKLYVTAFTLICSCLSYLTQAQVTRTWTGLGDGQSWTDGYNWNPVTCKYQNSEDGSFIYQVGHIPPRGGEIVLFDNVGTVNLTNITAISIGATDYTDYTEVVNNCGYGTGSLYSLQIINSNINMSGTQVRPSGRATPIAGFPSGLKLQNSILTCLDLAGDLAAGGGPIQPMTMNTIYAENSTITCAWWQSGFYTGGNTYFTNCIINCSTFSPYSNNDYPDEKDEFVDCTINAGMVYFGAKCTAIATNCIFNLISVNGTSNPIFGMNWYDTQNSVTLNNVVINVDSVATSPLIIAYKPGASVINGNINCNSVWIHNASNIDNFPLNLNGNLHMRNGKMEIRGALDITGNIVMDGTPDTNYTRDVVINIDSAFQIGGVLNYVNYGSSFYGPVPGVQRFGIKFSGSGDSHIKWPIGFPVDTLTIEKTGCGKVYVDNSPLHVTGKLQVNSGQLVLAPQASSHYSMVDGGDLIIKNGGSVLVQPGTNIAIAGSFIDENAKNNPLTCNGFCNAATDTVAFYNTIYSPANRILGSANNASIGNVAFINQDTYPYRLQNNLKVENCNLGTHGKILLGNYDYTVNGILSNCDSTRYFATSGTGSLQLKNVGSLSMLFPVGISDSSYTPLAIVNNGTPDDFKVRVQKGVLSEGNSGTIITGKAVNRTWFLQEGTPGGTDAEITLQWNTQDELDSLERDNMYLMHFSNNTWDYGSAISALGSNPWQLTRSGVTSFSPFAIGNGGVFSPVTAIEPQISLSEKNLFSIFPNPAKEVLNIRLSGTLNHLVSYCIINPAGIIIENGMVNIGEGSPIIPINIKKLPRGLYSLSLKSNETNYNLKFIKN